jgi:DNA-binding CsgD family transcriptional regulator
MAAVALSHEQLVGLIYDSVDGPAGWRPVQDAFLSAFDAQVSNLFVIGAGGSVLDEEIAGYRLDEHLPYHDSYQRQDPRMALALAHPGRVFSDVEVIEQRAYLKSPIYNEWLRPADVRYSLFVLLPAGHELSTAQAIMRSHRAAPFGADEVGRLERLLPHLARATQLRRVLVETRAELRDLNRALDLSPLPLAILDGRGRLICANARATPMLTRDSGLSLLQQRLSAVRPGEAAAIAHAISVAAGLAEPTRARSTATAVPPSVEVTCADGHRLALIFLPLRPHHGVREEAEARARVVVALHDPRAVLRLNPPLIAQVHGLTSTEAQLAAALASGKTAEAFAEERGSSVQTARTHLKRILEKTGTTRQADLVRVLLAGAAMHLGTSE